MAAYVIWMDSKEGKVFDLTPEGTKARHIHTHGHKNKPQPYGDHNGEHHRANEGLYKDIAESVKDAKEIILMGPADAKLHFKAYLEKHYAHSLAKKIVAVETVDHPTDNQILANARKFFKTYDLFQG